MRICLVLEGCYPYVFGGVSTWMHQYINQMQEHEFVLWVDVYKRQVYNHVRMFFLKKLVNCFTVCDALFYKTEIRVIHNRCQSRKITCIGKAVQTADAVVRVLF